MPFTLFHWGILVFGLVFFTQLYLPALFVSSVALDIEPFYQLLTDPNAALAPHGISHTFLAATVAGLLAAIVLIRFRKTMDDWMQQLHIGQRGIGNRGIIASSLLAAYSHIFLDSIMHPDLRPFWPVSDYNPFLGLVPVWALYLILSIGLVAALLLWARKIASQKKKAG